MGKSYRNISKLLEISNTMVGNAGKLIPAKETRGGRPKVTPAAKQRIIPFVKEDFITSSNQP